jgi:hypothetical protein
VELGVARNRASKARGRCAAEVDVEERPHDVARDSGHAFLVDGPEAWCEGRSPPQSHVTEIHVLATSHRVLARIRRPFDGREVNRCSPAELIARCSRTVGEQQAGRSQAGVPDLGPQRAVEVNGRNAPWVLTTGLERSSPAQRMTDIRDVVEVESLVLFALGALVPLLPFLVMGGGPVDLVAAAVSGVALFGLGAGITKLTGTNPDPSRLTATCIRDPCGCSHVWHRGSGRNCRALTRRGSDPFASAVASRRGSSKPTLPDSHCGGR